MSTGQDVWATLSRGLGPELSHELLVAGRSALDLGGMAYIVGGAVRDALLGRLVEDVDMVFDGPSGGVHLLARELSARWRAVFEAESAFGTVRLRTTGGTVVDIAMARSEVYPEPGALPQVVPSDIYRDLRRRDFAINAMAVDISAPSPGELIDPCGGYGDLVRGTIRVLHPRSFIDDPTRILRALRFCWRLGFSLEPATKDLLVSSVSNDLFGRVSGTRLLNELIRTSEEKECPGAYSLLNGYGCLEAIHPRLALNRLKRETLERSREGCVAVVDATGERVSQWIVDLLCLTTDASVSDWKSVCDRLDVDGRTHRKGLWVLSFGGRILQMIASKHTPTSRICRLLEGSSPEAVAYLAARCAVFADGRRIVDCWSAANCCNPVLNGDDLISMGYEPGPQLAEVLREIKDARLDGRVADVKGEATLARSLLLRTARTREES